MFDKYHRKIEYLRISLTDRCNLRCRYCMPEDGVKKLKHDDMLTLEEIVRVVRAIAGLGVKKVRLTGGEPLVRRGICQLIREIKAIEGIKTVSITTNGVLLGEMAEELMQAGLDSVNVSLDTLNEDTFAAITRRQDFSKVMDGINAIEAAGCRSIKLNCVPIKELNAGDIVDLAGLAKNRNFQVRYIELMPIGCAYEVGLHGIKLDEVRSMLSEAYGPLEELGHGQGIVGPAVYYRPRGFKGAIGFIDAIDHKFCSECNRVRLTSEGFLKLCLNAKDGLDLRSLLHEGATDDELAEAISQTVYLKPKEHFFDNKNNAHKDTRFMNQVGG